MTTENIPTSISFTDSDKTAATKRPTPTAGIHRWKVVDGERTMSKSGSYMLVYKIAPLKDPTDGDSAVQKYQQRMNILIPKRNESVPGHEAPGIGFPQMNLRAFLGASEIPETARQDKATRKLFLNGVEVSKEEANAARAAANEATFTWLARLWEDPTLLYDHVAYGTYGTNEGGYGQVEFFKEELGENDILAELT